MSTSDAGIVEHGEDDECVVKQDEDDQQLVEARLPHVGPAQDLHRQRVAKQPQEAEYDLVSSKQVTFYGPRLEQFMNHGSLIYVLQGVPKKSDSRTLGKQLLRTKSTREIIVH